jgi:hypothetical protein
MRFGRLILASLTALAAYSYAQDAPASMRPMSAADSLPSLLHAAAPLLSFATESSAAAPVVHPAAYSIFTLEALTPTSLGGSLCLLASSAAINFLLRSHPRTLLRC